MAVSANRTPPRSAGQVEADLTATRQRMVDSVETLIDTVHPNRIKQRVIAQAKATVRGQVDRLRAKLEPIRAQVMDEHGHWRVQRIAVAGGAIAAVAGAVVVIRAIARRS